MFTLTNPQKIAHRPAVKGWWTFSSLPAVEASIPDIRLLPASRIHHCGLHLRSQAHLAALAMAFKLIKEAEKSWRKIAKWQQLELVRQRREFKNGELVEESAA